MAKRLGWIPRFVAHSRKVLIEALRHGWWPGARYTNLRDVRSIQHVGFIDIDWKNYSFRHHLKAVKATRPYMTVARDIVCHSQLGQILDEALELSKWAEHVIVVPKALQLSHALDTAIPRDFLVGYSVPTRYGGTSIPTDAFNRPVHLLGGRPDRQRELAERMPVVSFDCNRFTLDAAFGDYFDGQSFKPHPEGGYLRCIRDSLRNINALWETSGKKMSPNADWYNTAIHGWVIVRFDLCRFEQPTSRLSGVAV